MSAHEDRPPEPAAAHRIGDRWLERIVRLLYTHNPFYLLSVAFVLHSTRLWLNTRAWPCDPWPLMYSHPSRITPAEYDPVAATLSGCFTS